MEYESMMKQTEKKIVADDTTKEPIEQRKYMTVEEQVKLKGYLRSWIDHAAANKMKISCDNK